MVSRDDQEPIRINIFIPSFNFDNFTGGPLSIFRFAYEMIKYQLRIRFICPFPPLIRYDLLLKHLDEKYNFPNIYQMVEYLEHPRSIKCNSQDLCMATLYTTVSIAHNVQRQINNKPILYFIQDYEPLFANPEDPHYQVALTSYQIPHFALFSTSFLRRYFEKHSIGIFAHSDPQYTEHQPAIRVKCNPSQVSKLKKRLIVYARPFAKRNRFDLVIATLNHVVSLGGFPSNSWEIIGLGSLEDKIIPLPNHQVFHIHKHKGEEEYFNFIQTGDVALSLMESPHPSLPPLDFVASGMIVVTNRWETKTEESLKEISNNFEVADLDVSSLSQALLRAQSRSQDLDSRLSGSQINWAREWSDDRCYGKSTADKIRKWMTDPEYH